jgi:hypothetical protein
MSCTALEYASIWNALVVLFGVLRAAGGDDGVALGSLAILMLGLVKCLEWIERYLRPKVIDYFVAHFRQQAQDWFNKGLAFLGFRVYTALVSLLLGTGYYFLLKAAIRFPSYWTILIPFLVVAFLAIAVVGYFVSGRVPDDPEARWRYCKRFYVPTVGGVSLVAINLVSDLLVGLSAALFALLQVAFQSA